MKLTGPQMVGELRDKLQFEIGRHLYGILGTYAQLARFEEHDLAQARDPQGRRLPDPVNLNRELLARIDDASLRQMVQEEARRPSSVQRRLNLEMDRLLGDLLGDSRLVFVKQFELIFAYELDLSIFRTRATNQNHLVLLLPGERRSEHVTLFHEAETRFQRAFPGNIIADNHLWELVDA